MKLRSPIAGSVLHFDLEETGGVLAYQAPTWVPMWRVDAVTGADGVARADVPLAGTGFFLDPVLSFAGVERDEPRLRRVI